MTHLYNCKTSGDQWKITKFDDQFNVESSYLCTETECQCPAGHRPSCRHRQMLPKFLHRGYVDSMFFYDHDRGGWVQGWKEEPEVKSPRELMTTDALAVEMMSRDVTPSLESEALPIQQEVEPSTKPELSGLQEELILMGFHQPELCDSLAPEGLGQASDPTPSPLCFDKDYSNSIGHSPGYDALKPSPSPTIRRRV